MNATGRSRISWPLQVSAKPWERLWDELQGQAKDSQRVESERALALGFRSFLSIVLGFALHAFLDA